MEYPRRILIMLILTFLQSSTGQVLSDEILFQHNSCYGSNKDYSIVNANCSEDTVIAVSKVQAGAKLNNSSCPIVLDENTTVDFDNCCKITADDCVVNVSTTIWHTLCSGNESCLSTQAVSVPSNCTSMFRSNTSYLQLDYYCINITRIGSTCNKITMTANENALYLWNSGYSYGVNADTDCVCSVQVQSCSANIEVTAMRIDLQDDNGTCIQNITFSDSYGNPEMVIDCSKQYDITSLFTSTSNYLSMNFISARNNTLGTYWIRFKATEAKSNLQVDCNPDVQQWSCTTTSTKTTSSTTTTTTTTTQKTTTATTRTSPSTKTRTTAAPTITTMKPSTTTGKTEKSPQQNLEYIALTALSIPIGIVICCYFRKRRHVKPVCDDDGTSMTTETESDSSTKVSTTTITETNSTTTTQKDTSRSPSSSTLISDSQTESTFILDEEIISLSDESTNTTTTTKTDTSRSPSPSTSISESTTTITETNSTMTTTPPITRSPTQTTVLSVFKSNLPSPPLCACSYCGQWGKHYHPIASSSKKYSKKKHFQCRYCGIFWEKITSLPLYSPCPFLSKQY